MTLSYKQTRQAALILNRPVMFEKKCAGVRACVPAQKYGIRVHVLHITIFVQCVCRPKLPHI